MLTDRKILKRPKGLSMEDVEEFFEAVNEAARRGYTIWHMTEEWNGRWHVRLADPNSNAPNMGDSFSYGRSGDTPGKAVYAVLEQFGATPDEKRAELVSAAISDEDSYKLRAPVRLSPKVVRDWFEAMEENLRARRSE